METNTDTEIIQPKRSDAILRKKFFQYLLPAMLTYAAFSLSEFVDSMIVANLLGSGALAIIQLGSPLLLICAAVYTLIGNGGSTLYAISLGERDNDKAGGLFTVSLITSAVIGTLLFVVGFIFFAPLADLICTNDQLSDDFDSYYSVLLFTVPFLIIIMTLVCFLAPSGSPALATVVNITANIVNIVMDYVYISIFNMGSTGAAWATLTGYLVGAIILIFSFAGKKINIKARKPKRGDIKMIRDIVRTGAPFSVAQIGFAIKYAFCNNMAQMLAEQNGIVAFSLTNQSLSIVSVFLAATVEASSPIMGMLHGENDIQGLKMLVKRVLAVQFILSSMCAMYFILFPVPFAELYNITGSEELELAIRALRIFSLMYFLRGYYMVYMKYYQVIGKSAYALIISILDGFALIIPICLILSSLIGIDGVWCSFPVSSAVLGIICFNVNLVKTKKAGHRLSDGVFGCSCTESTPVLDVTILDSDQEISGISEKVQQICNENGLDPELSMHTSMLVEETAVYMRSHSRKNSFSDIIVRITDEHVVINCRSIGAQADPNERSENDIDENIRILKGFSGTIENNYILGMNSMHIVIPR